MQNQGVGWIGSSEERICSGLSPQFADGQLPLVSLPVVSPLYLICVQCRCFHKDISHIGSGPDYNDLILT